MKRGRSGSGRFSGAGRASHPDRPDPNAERKSPMKHSHRQARLALLVIVLLAACSSPGPGTGAAPAGGYGPLSFNRAGADFYLAQGGRFVPAALAADGAIEFRLRSAPFQLGYNGLQANLALAQVPISETSTDPKGFKASRLSGPLAGARVAAQRHADRLHRHRMERRQHRVLRRDIAEGAAAAGLPARLPGEHAELHRRLERHARAHARGAARLHRGLQAGAADEPGHHAGAAGVRGRGRAVATIGTPAAEAAGGPSGQFGHQVGIISSAFLPPGTTSLASFRSIVARRPPCACGRTRR